MIGTTLAHYRITASLGKGGMGEVWRAEDTRLGRDVALKVLAEEFSDNAERLDRFEREARAVAALNHPHIVTIYSVEEAEGTRFLTMELVEGRTLEGMIPDGGFDLLTLFELAIPLAEAVSAAHDKSVIHRDLKPSNVMVDDDGRVKVMDFGLAKLHEADGVSDSSELATEALTGVGMVVGTVPYMSPEQIEGQIVDHRTDIFSLGVMLYEMAIGERPFQGSSSPGLMSSILKDVPQSVVEFRDDLPRHLGRIISRCLEKDRRDRYQTARDVFNELKALRRESSATSHSHSPVVPPSRSSQQARASSSQVRRSEVPWIAVLPLKAQGSDPQLDAFADGLGEDITTGLSRFPHLFVISRSSAMQYAERPLDVRAVGRELGARYALEGAVRKAGSAVRVSVQLLDAATGTHLWAETYDRDLAGAGIFNVQDEITDRVVATVADPYGVLVRSMAIAIRDRPVEELNAKELALRFCAYWHQIRPDEHARLRTALERTLESEPTHAEAWACLSRLYSNEHAFRLNPLPDSVERALRAAQRAVDIDPTCQLGWEALAEASYFARDLGTFRNAAGRAMELNPRNTSTMALMGVLMSHGGEWDRGIEIMRRSMELNPHHPGWYHFPQFFDHYRKREFDQALDMTKRLNMPEDFWVHAVTAAACGRLGRKEEARAALESLRNLLPGYRDELGPALGLWILDAAVVDQVMEGLAEAEAFVGKPQQPAPTSAAKPISGSGPAAGTGAVGIAVLPFADMSEAKDRDYFCEGMAEEIMNALVHVDGIQVASRTSSFRAVEEGKDLKAIGRTLSVDQVLEGSVRIAGGRLRVTAQLTEVESGYQLWSERFDREAQDVFAIQDEIAAGVVEAVTARLAPGERTVRERKKVSNLEAYQHYLKGRHYRYSKNDHASALMSFEHALALDPCHGPSWVGLAEVTVLAVMYSLIPAREAFVTAKEALATAFDLQGESAEGCYVDGMIAFAEARWFDAEKALLRSIELQPTFVQGHCWYAFVLSVQGRLELAEDSFSRARELDPLSAYPYGMTAAGFLAAGRPVEADGQSAQALEFDGENSLALWCSGVSKVANRHIDQGLAALDRAVEQSRRGGFVLGLLGWGLAVAGRHEEAEAIIAELRSRPQPSPAIVSQAWALAALGDADAAWEILDRAESEFQAMLYFIGMPPFDPLRADPRFQALLDRLGLPPSRVTPSGGSAVRPGDDPEKSIAVLPFVNMSPDAENEYFSDGLTEEIIADLSKIGALRVISRTSVMQLKGAKKNVQAIGRDLGVRYVLEGSVRKASNNLRITAQLIDAQSDAHLWSEKFSGTLDDVFEVQERVSREIVRALDLTLTSDENRRLAERPIANVRAFELVLQARQEIRRFDENALERAARLLEKAVEIEGQTPAILNLMALAKVAQAKAAANPDPGQLDEVEAQALAMLERDPEDPQAHALLGSVCYERGHQPQAVWHCNRALEGTSNDADAFLYLSASYMAAGQPEPGLDAGQRMVACDPLASISWMILGAAYWFVGRAEEAVPQLERSLELDPQNFLNHWAIGYNYATLGRLAEARRHAAFCHEASPENAYARQVVSLVAALEGRHDEALERLADLDVTPLDPHNKFHIAESFAMAGDIERALEILELAVEQGFYPYPFINEFCPFMEPLKALPEFTEVLATAKEKTEAFREDGPLRPSSFGTAGETG